MRKQLLAVVLLAITMVAAAPKDPIITVDGAAAAAKLSDELRAAIAPRVLALNSAFEKVVAARAAAETATPEHRTVLHASLQGIHEECLRLYHEIGAQLDPEQRAAFMAYLHAQLKGAGIDPAHLHHSTMHPDHTPMPHGAHVSGGA